MGEIAESLLKHMPDASGYDIPYAEIRDRQIAAVNERFQEQVGRIKLVKLRAQDAEISEIKSLEDVIPRAMKYDTPYTYWDYRAGMFHKNMGMRIDLFLASSPVAAAVRDAYVDRDARKGKGPSDHAPIVVDLD